MPACCVFWRAHGASPADRRHDREIPRAAEAERQRAYAEAYSTFCAQMLSVAAYLFGEDFTQSFPMEVSFIPMMHQTKEGKLFIAEKAAFNSLTAFLRTELYRGLAVGNAPRRCHNCGRDFLLTAGYNTCYYSNIAPSETERTCRKVGTHRREAQGKASRTPAQAEYDRTYNRLKQRKNRRAAGVVDRACADLSLTDDGSTKPKMR